MKKYIFSVTFSFHFICFDAFKPFLPACACAVQAASNSTQTALLSESHFSNESSFRVSEQDSLKYRD